MRGANPVVDVGAVTTSWAAQLEALMDPSTFVGRAPEQVSQFLAEEVVPALAPFQSALTGKAEVLV